MKGDWDFQPDPLAALRDGDPGPFEEFVRRKARELIGFFRRQGAGLDQAEDLTQEVFLKLYNHAPRYREQERFAAYCFRVAKNVWIDDCRRQGVRPVAVSLDGTGDEAAGEGAFRLSDRIAAGTSAAAGNPVERATVREDEGRLRASLADLPEHHRLVFELGAVQELSYAEISSILDIPIGTVKSRMFHAVRKLREALEGAE